MSKTSRIDHQLVLLSFPFGSRMVTRLIFPIHRVPTFLAVFQREYPRVPHLRLQFGCCVNVFGVTFTDFVSLEISTFLSPFLCLEFLAATCTNNEQLTFRNFETHPRIVSVLLSFRRNLCLSGFLFLSCNPSCPCPIFLCRSLSGRLHRLPLNLRRVFPAEVVLKMRLLLK